MHAIKILRDKLGLSQLEVAKILGMGRPLLTLVETNRRTLQSGACMRLARLEQALAKDSPMVSIELPSKVHEKHCRGCEFRETRLRYRIFQLKENLTTLEKTYKQSQRLFNVLTDLEMTVIQILNGWP